MADEPEKPAEPDKPERSLGETVVARITDFVVSTIVLLAIAFVFERITSTESMSWALDAAIGAQNALTKAVAGLNPLHLLNYWFDTMNFIGQPLNYVPEGFVDFLKIPIRLVLGFLALCAMPIATIVEGSPFEWVLVLGFYLPLFFWLKSRAHDPNDQLMPGRSLAYAFLFTILFYWIVQLVLNGTLAAFGSFIHTARLAVGGSIAISTVVWAVGKRSEHSVTERVLQLVLRTRGE